MINPSYRIQIDICLNKPVAEDSIWVRHIRMLPFVPRDGDVIRLTSEDEEYTQDITLENVVYDTAEGFFIIDIEDNTLIENYREHGVLNEKEVLAEYKTFGFERLNFPTAQVVR